MTKKVVLEVFNFETEEEALAYADKLTDAFCAMPESKDLGAACLVEDDNERIYRTTRCPTCRSQGFERSKVFPDQCEFCDGTFNGEIPGYD